MGPELLHVFPTFVAGGAQVRTVRLMEAFGDAYRHGVLALDGRHDARELVAEGVALELLEPIPRAGTWATAKRLRALLRERRPAALCTYNWGAIDAVLAARLGGPPLLHHEDGFHPDEARRFKRRRVWTRRLALRGADVVVPSRTLQRIATEVWRLEPGRVHYIPNGIDVTGHGRADGNPPLRRELGIAPDAFVVGFVGHLRAEKNAVRLVEAFAALDGAGGEAGTRRAELLLLGDGPERGAIEAAARARGVADRVHLAGHQPATEPYYRAMDVFALSSDTEQMPVSLLEAMATSLPVVSTDVGDVARMLPDEQRRFVVPLGDGAARALAGALGALRDDASEARRIGAGNRAHVERAFAFETTVERYRECYERAVARGS